MENTISVLKVHAREVNTIEAEINNPVAKQLGVVVTLERVEVKPLLQQLIHYNGKAAVIKALEQLS